MSGKDLLQRRPVLSAGVLTDRAVLARDLAQWLEDREAASVQDRALARKRLECRTGVPQGVFWTARYRARETLGKWLDRLIAARVAVLKGEVRELETTVAAARALNRSDLEREIVEAETSLENARSRLRSISGGAPR